jgi:hypothetical protein
MSNHTSDVQANSSRSRWLKYGSNLVVMLLISICIVGLLGYLTTNYAHHHQPLDWTTGGLFTLSDQTKNLLKEADQKNVSIEIIDDYSVDATSTATDMIHAQQVRDLLDQYVRQSSSVKIFEPKGRDELETKIRERYKGETKPYEETIKAFGPLAEKLVQFFKDQGSALLAMAGDAKNLTADDTREVQGIAAAFNKEFPDQINKVRQNIRKSTESTSPEWSQAKSQATEVITQISDQLKQIANASPDSFSKFTQDYIKKAAPEYAAMLKEVDAYKDRLDKLPDLKIDDVVNSIGPNTLIVIGPDVVKVIPSGDMFKADTSDPGAPDPKYAFQGEQAISTALMGMIRPSKPKIVFVTSAPSQLLSGPFSDINDRLTKANFDVSEWSPPGMPNPDQPPPPATPPASGKDANGKPVVWVVLPPDPPNMQQMQMGMPPPDVRPLVDAVKKHMDAGGNVLFLAEGTSPMAQMGGGGAGYPFGPLINPFGIQVKDSYYIMHTMRLNDDTVRTGPQVEITTYPDGPITGPLQSLTTIFVGSPTQMGIMGAPTVVDVAKPAPTGTTPTVILQSPASADVFATTNTMAPNPQFDPKTDLAAPIPMGAASSLANGSRIVVLGNKLFLVNQLLEEPVGIDMQSRQIIYRFPGNAELLLNSVAWLSGYENMIAVSPQANVAQRIASMSFGQELTVRIGSWIVPPLLAIAIGTAIFFIRRRA